MSCLPLPAVPQLPDITPFSLAPPSLPAVNVGVDLCCKIDLQIIPPVIPLGPLLITSPTATAVIMGINAAMIAVKKYIDALPLSCPLE